MSAWTDERKAEAKRLWAEGLSASQIAAALGEPYVTRNAVIGVIHRGGESRRDKVSGVSAPSLSADKLERERKRQLLVRGHANRVARGNVARSKPLTKRPAVVIQPAEPTSATNVSLLDLPFFGACKFPVGAETGARQMFCGADVGGDEHRYCGFHRLKTYAPRLEPRGRPASGAPKPIHMEA